MEFREFLEDERPLMPPRALVRGLARYGRRLKYGDVRAAHGIVGFVPPDPLQPGNRIPDATAIR